MVSAGDEVSRLVRCDVEGCEVTAPLTNNLPPLTWTLLARVLEPEAPRRGVIARLGGAVPGGARMQTAHICPAHTMPPLRDLEDDEPSYGLVG